MADRASNQKKYSQSTSIALWGPTGAGKDWLFRSFRKELDYYNQKDPGFYYDLQERDPGEWDANPKLMEMLSNNPSPGIEVLNYVFKRESRATGVSKSTNTHIHDLIIHNDAGQNLVRCLDDQDTFESTFRTLVNADSLLLVLSIPSEAFPSLSQKEQPSIQTEPDTFVQSMENPIFSRDVDDEIPETDREILSKETYLIFMKRLLDSLSNGTRRNLAICMTKSDLLNFRGEPWAMLELRYGLAMRKLLERYQQQHNIEVFATSAAGYLKKDGKLLPNINHINGTLREPNHWNPVNTAAPFFWIFEKIELARLENETIWWNKKQVIDTYIRYPDPRPF